MTAFTGTETSDRWEIVLQDLTPEQEDTLYRLAEVPGMGKRCPTLVDIDVELRPLLKDMWEQGYKTLSSCSGHKRSAGYLIFRPPRERTWEELVWPETVGPPRTAEELERLRARPEDTLIEDPTTHMAIMRPATVCFLKR